jgi:hypothetical protein
MENIFWKNFGARKRGPESQIVFLLTFIYFFGECSSDAGYALQSTCFFILGGRPCQFQNDGWRAAKISKRLAHWRKLF